MKMLFIIPAYGRRYETEEALRKDWEDGKDFKILNGPYLSIRDQDQIEGEIYAVSWNSPKMWTRIKLK